MIPEYLFFSPSECCACCSFDCDIMYRMGEAFGDEMIKEGISLILGPGVNIKRSPLCGRNFEYFSEDPYLSTKIASSLIKGIQSKGVGPCIKHFACNNQEYLRFFSNSQVDERALREIYLASFEGAIREAKPWMVMASYNSMNNTHSSNNYEFLTTILREEWKWNINDDNEPPISGIVMSDLGGDEDPVLGLKAGLDLDNPGNNDDKSGMKNCVKQAIQDGELDVKYIDASVERILNVVKKAHVIIEKSKKDETIGFNKKMRKVKGFLDEHHQITREIAENSIVLLKNDSSILPLPTKCDDQKAFKILFIGGFAEYPHIQGAGSSRVEPYKISNIVDEANEIVQNGNVVVSYLNAYKTTFENAEKDRIREVSASKDYNDITKESEEADIVVVFAGTLQYQEIEGTDRKSLKLQTIQNEAIQEVLKVNKNVVVVLQNGSPVEMPWINDVKAVLETYFSGEGGPEATARILFGLVNPSGHLAETFPIKLEDNPSFMNFGLNKTYDIKYKEGIFVGYRHYDTHNIEVLFPFGHGLSYTTFEYSNIRLKYDGDVIKFKRSQGEGESSEDAPIVVQVDVKNTGKRTGKTVAQLYVSDLVKQVEMPSKELKGFKKVNLEPDETKTISFTLDKRAFAWWNTERHDWFVSEGEFNIIIGQSSRDPNSLVLKVRVEALKDLF